MCQSWLQASDTNRVPTHLKALRRPSAGAHEEGERADGWRSPRGKQGDWWLWRDKLKAPLAGWDPSLQNLNPQGAVHQILWSRDTGKDVSREAVKAKSILLPQDTGKHIVLLGKG